MSIVTIPMPDAEYARRFLRVHPLVIMASGTPCVHKSCRRTMRCYDRDAGLVYFYDMPAGAPPEEVSLDISHSLGFVQALRQARKEGMDGRKVNSIASRWVKDERNTADTIAVCRFLRGKWLPEEQAGNLSEDIEFGERHRTFYEKIKL